MMMTSVGIQMIYSRTDRHAYMLYRFSGAKRFDDADCLPWISSIIIFQYLFFGSILISDVDARWMRGAIPPPPPFQKTPPTARQCLVKKKKKYKNVN